VNIVATSLDDRGMNESIWHIFLIIW
jgi:hypothetical protein